MELFLVRHAIAHDRDPAAWPDDGLRPLTPEGEASFRKAAAGLGKIVTSVERVLASPMARAWRTAEILTEVAAWPAPEPEAALEAGRSTAGAVKVIAGAAGIGSLALVGHEPNLSDLASRLLAGSDGAMLLEMKKGGVACLRLDQGGVAALRWVATPRILRTLAG